MPTLPSAHVRLFSRRRGIVDTDARTVEHYRPDDSFEILTESLEWRPDHDAPPLVIDLPAYFDRVHGLA
ncbi:MAG TPA: hypothetical protein VFW03_04670 [Gemmatimonadaceae bacterium]|nr:hypothetical protein [Gemmatimonadaceae bacterium]